MDVPFLTPSFRFTLPSALPFCRPSYLEATEASGLGDLSLRFLCFFLLPLLLSWVLLDVLCLCFRRFLSSLWRLLEVSSPEVPLPSSTSASDRDLFLYFSLLLPIALCHDKVEVRLRMWTVRFVERKRWPHRAKLTCMQPPSRRRRIGNQSALVPSVHRCSQQKTSVNNVIKCSLLWSASFPLANYI